MKFPKLITRKRLKWTGLAATLLLALAMIESDAFWPSFTRSLKPPSVRWKANVVPGAIEFSKNWFSTTTPKINDASVALDTRIAYEERTRGFRSGFWWIPEPFVWLPSYQASGNKAKDSYKLVIPLWIPLALVALPTAFLFCPARKPKPGFCTKCRYDLTGLTSDTCPECGTAIKETELAHATKGGSRAGRHAARWRVALRVAKAKLKQIMTSRRAMWAGLAMTACLVSTLTVSYRVWPSFSWGRAGSPTIWRVGLGPGTIHAVRYEVTEVTFRERYSGFKLDRKSEARNPIYVWPYRRYGHSTPIQWLSRVWFLGMGGHGPQSVVAPLWVPLALCAVPTGILVYHHRRRKARCCAKCRYDLTGLSSDTCPECGETTVTTL